MIATRRRPKKKFDKRKLLLPAVALVMLAVALWWQPSRRSITGFFTTGPLAAVSARVGAIAAPYLSPLHFAAQEQVIADRNKQIEALGTEMESERKELAAKDSQISALQNQIKQLQSEAAKAAEATPTPGPVRTAGAVAAAGAAAPAAQQMTDDPKHAAQVWATMDPEQAAAVAQRLPVDYTAKVLAVMNSDAAGAVIGALPPAYAAKVARVSTAVPQ
jgi:flagellar motility protein MotE (MotC chaperone)